MNMQKQERVTLYGMDCRDAMGLFMAENSVDSIVTDPPYGLGFMGKVWDHGVPGVEFWRHAYEVLKPGGHLLAFSGSRTYHRMVCAIEDAGFEIRDQIMWVYGSGFPKSLDVSKAIDKAAGVAFDAIPANGVGFMNAEGAGGYNTTKNQLIRAGESTDAAKQWHGWGTALKPAHEPICVARKPLIGTVAANVLHWGTGALNIDACRVATDENLNGGAYAKDRQESTSEWAASGSLHKATGLDFVQPVGRWPANLIHDGSDEVLAGFPEAKSGGANGVRVGGTNNCMSGGNQPRVYENGRGPDTGSAARFFYCAKTSKADRNEGLGPVPAISSHGATLRDIENAPKTGNHHPTVKPTDLMAYLCRLVTPPGGVVLDPFMGSGSTGKAALREGFRFIGCELDEGYMQIAQARLAAEAGAQA